MQRRLAYFPWLLVAAAICGLSGCASRATEAPLANGSYPLAETQTAALNGSTALRYDRFIDSRCPKEVVCIWAGKISHQFTLTSARGGETFTLDVGGDQYAPHTLNGVSIVLTEAADPAVAPARAGHAVLVSVVVH
jgi:hypothetical protein